MDRGRGGGDGRTGSCDARANWSISGRGPEERRRGRGLKLADQAIAADLKPGMAYDVRNGSLKLGKVKGPSPFDRHWEMVPAPPHWRRGLTLYYADEFAKGGPSHHLRQGRA